LIVNWPQKICIDDLQTFLYKAVNKTFSLHRTYVKVRKDSTGQRLIIEFLCKEPNLIIGAECEHPRTKEEVTQILNGFREILKKETK